MIDNSVNVNVLFGRLKRRADGRFQKHVPYIDENGEKKRKTVYGRTKQELVEKYINTIDIMKLKGNRLHIITVRETMTDTLDMS